VGGAGGDRVDVSVLVPVLNEETYIRDATRAMLSQRLDGEIEFIFIDGRSEDRTLAILEELATTDGRIRILDNPRRSTPVALNIGLDASRGEVVARMDAHTHYPPDYIARGVERLRHGGAEHVSGPQLPHGVGTWSRRVALALNSRLGTGEAAFRHSSEGEIEVDSGFTGLWWRATLQEHRGWDEDWPNDQDTELAARIRKSGGAIVCIPEMAASYIPRDSLGKLVRQYWRYGFYRAKTSRAHPESMRRSHVLAPGLALAVLAAALPLGPLARAARLGLLAYAAAVIAVSAAQARRAGARDAAALPVVFAGMHLPWGVGFLAGAARFGPPLPALARILGIGRPKP
jgi:succinoglycan biosynthesis protein ExoA